MVKITIGMMFSFVILVLMGVASGYRLEKLTAVDLPGFSTGKYYIVRAGVDPGYGYKFYVQNDAGQHTILSPWHFGYSFQ